MRVLGWRQTRQQQTHDRSGTTSDQAVYQNRTESRAAGKVVFLTLEKTLTLTLALIVTARAGTPLAAVWRLCRGTSQSDCFIGSDSG